MYVCIYIYMEVRASEAAPAPAPAPAAPAAKDCRGAMFVFVAACLNLLRVGRSGKACVLLRCVMSHGFLVQCDSISTSI